MHKHLIIAALHIIYLSIGGVSALHGAKATIQARVPKTAYIQWLDSPSQKMSQAFASHADVRLQGTGSAGSATNLYLGVMCNSTGGYELRFTARDAKSRTTALARGAGGLSAEYKMSLAAIGNTFWGGAQQYTNLDLTGGSSSAQVSFSDGYSLPLKAVRPNVFHLKATSVDALPAGQVLQGGVTVQIVVR